MNGHFASLFFLLESDDPCPLYTSSHWIWIHTLQHGCRHGIEGENSHKVEVDLLQHVLDESNSGSTPSIEGGGITSMITPCIALSKVEIGPLYLKLTQDAISFKPRGRKENRGNYSDLQVHILTLFRYYLRSRKFDT